MPQYRYTDIYERSFSDLSHGPGVRVLRGGEPVEVPDDAAGSTVVLIAGDVLETDEPLGFFHVFLEGSTHPEPPADADVPAVDEGSVPPADTPATPAVPEPAKPRKPRNAPEDTPPAGDTPTA